MAQAIRGAVGQSRHIGQQVNGALPDLDTRSRAAAIDGRLGGFLRELETRRPNDLAIVATEDEIARNRRGTIACWVLSAVLLDVGGTLWTDTSGAPLSPAPILERLAALLPDIDPANALAYLRAALRDDDASLVQDTHGVLHRCIGSLRPGSSPNVDPVAIRRALCQPASTGIQLFAGAVELLACIRTLGLHCVIVSNVQVRGATEYWRDFADLGVADCIDAVVTSLDVGYRKPHLAIFEAALRAANCGAESCVVIGNSEVKDIQPAVAMGMRAIRVAIEEPLSGSTAAQATASNLTDVCEILQGWSQRI
jgi:FMN phosphatase YigB (HAD superfamily)